MPTCDFRVCYCKRQTPGSRTTIQEPPPGRLPDGFLRREARQPFRCCFVVPTLSHLALSAAFGRGMRCEPFGPNRRPAPPVACRRADYCLAAHSLAPKGPFLLRPHSPTAAF